MHARRGRHASGSTVKQVDVTAVRRAWRPLSGTPMVADGDAPGRTSRGRAWPSSRTDTASRTSGRTRAGVAGDGGRRPPNRCWRRARGRRARLPRLRPPAPLRGLERRRARAAARRPGSPGASRGVAAHVRRAVALQRGGGAGARWSSSTRSSTSSRAPQGEEPALVAATAARVADGAVRPRSAAHVPARRRALRRRLPGPQFETPAEAAWLAGLGDVVGMSAAPEVRAGAPPRASWCVLALAVLNRSGGAVGP